MPNAAVGQQGSQGAHGFTMVTRVHKVQRDSQGLIGTNRDSEGLYRIHTWTGTRASGIPKAAVRKMQATSPMLEEIR